MVTIVDGEEAALVRGGLASLAAGIRHAVTTMEERAFLSMIG